MSLSARGQRADVLSLFEDILRAGTDLRVRVTGRSMHPFLRGGEVLTIRKTPTRSVRRGDLILCRNRFQVPVLHRVVNKRTTASGTFCMRTKGDALPAYDEELPEDSVLGKVFRIEQPSKDGRIVYLDMNSPACRCRNYAIAVAGSVMTEARIFLSWVWAKRNSTRLPLWRRW